MLQRSGLGFVLAFLTIIITTAWVMAAKAMPQMERFGDYEVHVSPFNSTFLNPAIAKSYNIERAPNQALINIAVLKARKTVEAQLDVQVSNLLGQTTELQPQLVDEGDAKYYLAPFGITNDEVLHFNIKVTPDNENTGHTIRFSQKFYVE